MTGSTSNSPKSESKTKSDGKKDTAELTALEEAIDIGRTVLIAVAITLFVRFFFYQPFNIPSGSMKPTLLIGDFILVDKIEYGYSRASLIFPMTRAPMEGRLFSDTPQRGEVVVFKNACDRNKDYIKRVIGLPGDDVAVRDGIVQINGELARREPIEGKLLCDGRQAPDARLYHETLPGMRETHVIQECNSDRDRYGRSENWGPKTVPEGHYFLMGDNRDNSSDGRTSLVGYRPLSMDTGSLNGCDLVGTAHFVPLDQVVGRATRVAMSIDGEKARIWELWKWPTAIRYGRVFDRVD